MHDIPRPQSPSANHPDHYIHACALFRSRDEEYETLAPFIVEGLTHGERALHVVDPCLRVEHLDRLLGMGLDTSSLRQTGQLDVLTWDETYFRTGPFAPNAMLQLVDQALGTPFARGYSRVRTLGHMEWALATSPQSDGLLEYEARVNDVLAAHHAYGFCAYDLTQFGADIILDVLRTHPMVVIGRAIRENPFYMPPSEFLEELRERRRAEMRA